MARYCYCKIVLIVDSVIFVNMGIAKYDNSARI